jgi:hypothetical protein
MGFTRKAAQFAEYVSIPLAVPLGCAGFYSIGAYLSDKRLEQPAHHVIQYLQAGTAANWNDMPYEAIIGIAGIAAYNYIKHKIESKKIISKGSDLHKK